MAVLPDNPPITCTACSRMEELDLKAFIHYGEYMVKSFSDRNELVRSEVILAHRMMMNDVTEKTGLRSYLHITDKTVEELNMNKTELSFTDISYIMSTSVKQECK